MAQPITTEIRQTTVFQPEKKVSGTAAEYIGTMELTSMKTQLKKENFMWVILKVGNGCNTVWMFRWRGNMILSFMFLLLTEMGLSRCLMDYQPFREYKNTGSRESVLGKTDN